MGFYEAILERLDDEQTKKRLHIYNGADGALITRFFATQEPYPKISRYVVKSGLFTQNSSNQDAANRQPTMFTPWGKVLCPNDFTSKNEEEYANKATFLCSLKSILTQLIYDIIHAMFYTLIAIPSAVMGACYFFYSICIETDSAKQQEQKQFAEEIGLGNVLLSPYFSMAIIVDFLRESCALTTRTYATLMQTPKKRNTFNCAMG